MPGSPTQSTALDLVLAVWNRRKLPAIVTFVLSLVATMTIVVSLPSLYRATATILVARQQMAESFVRSTVTGELDTRLQTVGQEVLSRARLEALIERFGLYPEMRRHGSTEAAVERARKDIQVELRSVDSAAGRGTTIAFAVSYRGWDPDTVARVANTVASSYIEANLKLREQQATDTAQFLKAQLDEMQQRLGAEEKRVGEFKRRYAGELPEQVNVNQATLQRLNTQLSLNNERQMRATERRAALARDLAGTDAGGVGEGTDATTRLFRLQLELAKLQGQYSDKYPDVVRLKAEIASLKKQLAESGRSAPAEAAATAGLTSLGGIDAELRALKSEEQELRRAIATYERHIEAAPQREQEFQELSRDYRTTRELYDSMLKRYQDAQVAEDMERSRNREEFRLLDPALPPRMPSAPNRARLALVSLAASLGVAAAAAMLAEHRDSSFHTVEDLRAFTRVPVLARIPAIASAVDAVERRRRLRLAVVSLPVALALVGFFSYRLAHGNEQLVWMLSRGGS